MKRKIIGFLQPSQVSVTQPGPVTGASEAALTWREGWSPRGRECFKGDGSVNVTSTPVCYHRGW